MNVNEENFTALEQERLVKDLCLKCGKHITEQNYYGSLCTTCNELYFPIDARNKKNLNSNARFLAFIRDNKVKVEFT